MKRVHLHPFHMIINIYMTTNWTYKDCEILEIDPCYVGFVYIITQISTGKQYIGKKKCFFKKTTVKTVTLKNGTKKKKKIRSLIPSDWSTYYGSSDKLKEEIVKSSVSDFKREIVSWATSLSDLSYQEAKLQFETDCLMHPDRYFNEWIMVKVRRVHLVKK